MSKSLQVLFLHNLNDANKEITLQNYNSFRNNNIDIQPIHDEDLEGLTDSFPVPLKSHIPRGSRRWSTETVLFNYILLNQDNLIHDYYMFCEWDCYCNCDLNKFIQPYYDYDVCAPHIVFFEKEPNWQWFDGFPCNIKNKKKKIGFRPSVFILFKKESIIYLAKAYKKLWNFFNKINSESRIATISNLLDFKIGEYKNISNNVEWFECIFKKDSEIIHPVKHLISDKYFIPLPYENTLFSGKWNFSRLNETSRIGNLVLNKDGTISGYDNFNEKFWSESDDTLTFYNWSGGITTIFLKDKSNPNALVGNFYNGAIFNELKLINKNYHIIFRD